MLDDPRQVLIAQQKQRRGEEIAALKADGVDYTERMAIVEDITWPKPLEELLEQAYDTFAKPILGPRNLSCVLSLWFATC